MSLKKMLNDGKFIELCVIFYQHKSLVICNVQTRLGRTSPVFLYGTKLGEGSHSASADEAKFITVIDGAASERPLEKSLST